MVSKDRPEPRLLERGGKAGPEIPPVMFVLDGRDMAKQGLQVLPEPDRGYKMHRDGRAYRYRSTDSCD